MQSVTNEIWLCMWSVQIQCVSKDLGCTFAFSSSNILPLSILHKHFHCMHHFILINQVGCRWYSAGSDVMEAHAMAWNLTLLSNHVTRGKEL